MLAPLPHLLDALRLSLLLSLPVLGVALVVGAGVGLFQAATQLAEPSVNAIARLVSGGLVLALSAQWMGSELVRYTTALFQALPSVLP